MEGKFKIILMNRIFDCELELAELDEDPLVSYCTYIAELDEDPLVSYCTYINKICGFSKSGN
jgi:hypothetical protein